MSKVSDRQELDQVILLRILEAIKSIRYGSVQITIQDSKVVQIDKTEKVRTGRPRDCICR